MADITEVPGFGDDVTSDFLLNVEIELIRDRGTPATIEESKRSVRCLPKRHCSGSGVAARRSRVCGKAIAQAQSVAGFSGRSHQIHRIGISQRGSGRNRVTYIRPVKDSSATSEDQARDKRCFVGKPCPRAKVLVVGVK